MVHLHSTEIHEISLHASKDSVMVLYHMFGALPYVEKSAARHTRLY